MYTYKMNLLIKLLKHSASDWRIIILSSIVIQVVLTIDTPEQIHISFGDDHRSMVVMWASRDSVNGSVLYGTSAHNLTSSAESRVSQLQEEDHKACAFIHRTELTGLQPDTRYFYKVVSTTSNNSTDQRESMVYNFKTTGDTQTDVRRYLVYGDMGADSKIPTFSVLEALIRSKEYTAVWHIGDIGYDLDSDHGRVGDEFLRRIQPVAAYIPYMTSPGNHEIARDFFHYRTRFSTPRTPWPIPLQKMWYSYDVGLVHFISYSTEVFFTSNAEYACQQFYWLLQDLISANEKRDKTPWIIATGHRPMYCSNNNGDDCTGRFLWRWVKRGLEDLFHAQGVDLVIEAHEHSYERLWPTYDDHVYQYNYDNPKAPVHVISGAAGSEEGINWMGSKGNIWSAVRSDSSSLYTFGNLEIHNITHLFFEQKEATSNKILDSFWLIQNDHGPFVPNVTCYGVKQKKHVSCTCPNPFRYMNYIIAFSCFAFLVILMASLYFSAKQYRKQKETMTKKNSAEITVTKTDADSIVGEEELIDVLHDDKSVLLL